MEEALLILHLLAFPFQARHSCVPRGAVVLLPPPLGVPGGALPPPLENTKLKGNHV